MLIKVFNKETASLETIDSKDLNVSIHTHRNTHEAFTKEDLESFGYKKTETKK